VSANVGMINECKLLQGSLFFQFMFTLSVLVHSYYHFYSL